MIRRKNESKLMFCLEVITCYFLKMLVAAVLVLLPVIFTWIIQLIFNLPQ